MATIPKINLAGTQVGDVHVSDALASYPCNAAVVHAAVVVHQSLKRRGTASTLTKGTVDATGRKPWAQKHTGRARAGYIASPLWRGGGVVFGPHPHEYYKKINRKARRSALFGVLAERVRAGAVRIVDSWQMDAPKTKTIATLKKALAARTLLCLGLGEQKNAELSARNVAQTVFLDVNATGVYDVLTHATLVIAEDAWRHLEERFAAAVATPAAG
jgi:large subunit ribosomal protein L4